MKRIIASLTLALALPVLAQTTPSAPAGFTVSSDALAINCTGSWGAGNLTQESYDLLDYGANKNSRIFIQGVELTAPSCGVSIFGGGIAWQPDLTALLKKTNLSAGNFLFSLDGSAGNAIPTKGSDHVAAIVGGRLKYIINDTLTWNTVSFQEVLYGSHHYPAVSSGLTAFFGGTASSPAVSSNVKSSLLRKAARIAKIQ